MVYGGQVPELGHFIKEVDKVGLIYSRIKGLH